MWGCNGCFPAICSIGHHRSKPCDGSFLPPILLSSAYQTVWLDFSKYSATISSLAVGGVVFTTFAVALVVRYLRPDLPWSTAFALGAVVSPPEAVAAKAVLGKLRLPEKVTTVLTGESLVNDASGRWRRLKSVSFDMVRLICLFMPLLTAQPHARGYWPGQAGFDNHWLGDVFCSDEEVGDLRMHRYEMLAVSG